VREQAAGKPDDGRVQVRTRAATAAALVAGLCGSLALGSSVAAVPIHAANVAKAVEPLGAIAKIRCCRWGPRGWYDTWRNCHYCGPRWHRPCRWIGA
jgi:hypothetical protein